MKHQRPTVEVTVELQLNQGKRKKITSMRNISGFELGRIGEKRFQNAQVRDTTGA